MSSVARYEHHGPYYGGKQATILCSSGRLPRRVLDCIFLRRCKRCNTRTNNRRRVWYETVPSAAPVAACDHQKGLLFYFILSMVQSELDELVGTRRTPRPGNPSPAQAAARGGHETPATSAKHKNFSGAARVVKTATVDGAALRGEVRGE